jgi:PAS domain S-box-containing protein
VAQLDATSTPGAARADAERSAAALDAAGLGTWSWDLASGVVAWDAGMERLHGLPPGAFGGTFDDALAAIQPDDHEVVVTHLEVARASRERFVLTYRTVWPDGSLHWIECRGRVARDAEDRPTLTMGAAIDVTTRERRRAAIGEALAEQRALVETLQASLLPAALPSVPGTSVTARYRTPDIDAVVGGDWYAVLPLSDGCLGLGIGDVAGHGLDAVADMASARFSLRALALDEPRPDVVLGHLNQVINVFESDTMITALYGVLDPVSLTWTYASAGHLPAVLRQTDGTRLLDEHCDPPLPVADRFRAHETPVGHGAILLLYTDGLVERRNEPITAGMERLVRACQAAPAHLDAFCDYVLDAMLDPGGATDDVALLAVAIE